MSLVCDREASPSDRGQWFSALPAGHHPVLSIGGNARRQCLKTTFALLCPRSPGLTPRPLFGYSIVDSLIFQLDNNANTLTN
jgi:hypothetical protein